MRTPTLVPLFLVAIGACGSDNAATPDAPGGNHPPPRVIPGGGIGDGPIDGVVNLYAIDDATRMPIADAHVRIGTVDGTTDATGLFVAEGVRGAQTVAVAAPGYRAELWLGANGANLTIDLHPAIDPAPATSTLTGTITGFASLTVPAGHHKAALVGYSADDAASDAENNLANAKNACDVTSGGCNFTIDVRPGALALVAVILDHDVLANTYTVIGWATRTGLLIQPGVDQSAQDLTLVPADQLATVQVAFGAPPPALGTVAAVVGLELGTQGTLELPQLLTPASPSVLVPALAAFPGSTYRVTAIATKGSGATDASSLVVGRHQTQTSLTVPAWLPPPDGLSLTRTGGSWSPIAGATIQGADYDQGTTHLLSVTSLDGSTSFTVPDLITLPTGAALAGHGTALAGAIDPTSFAIDDVRDKISALSSQPMPVQ